MSFFQRLFPSKSSPPSAPPEQTQSLSPSDLSPPHNSTTTRPNISTHPPPPPQPQPSSLSPFPSPIRNQFSFLLAGVAFVGLSSLITRRSVLRRRIAIIPRFFHPSIDAPAPPPTNGAMEAFEALNIATVNVISHAIFWAGGLVWAFDIRGTDDLRARLRKGLGFEGVDEKDAEEEFEEWLAETLTRKEEKRRKRSGRKGEGGREEKGERVGER